MFAGWTPPVEKKVAHTQELSRILTIPRRTPEPFPEDMVDRMTEALKTPHGTMRLLNVQARALYELGMYGGLFAPIRVCGGKTLISLLAPTVLKAWRPLLLIPASLIPKTEEDRQELTYHWQIPKWMRIESYSILSTANNANMLELYKPDLIVADEAHKLRDLKTAVTTRVNRYMRHNPGTKVAMMTGTMMKRSIKDFAHLARYALKERVFMPARTGDILEWSNALDERPKEGKRTQPGALLKLCSEEDQGETPLNTARNGFKRRMLDTAGVVTLQQDELDIPLTITAHQPYELAPCIIEAFERLRNAWVTPDGWQLWDAFEIARHARSLALGFYYRWNPRPPEDWYQARKAWGKACREIILDHSNQLDSAEQVTRAIGSNHIGCREYQPWIDIEPSFIPNSEAVWLDYTSLYKAAEWAAESPGVVWTQHTAFADALVNMTGMSYYAGSGLCERTNALIKHEHGDRSIISSLHANRQGQNLQMFNRALAVSPPCNGEWWQQWIGRHHRPGQTRPVHFDIWQSCLEDVRALDHGERDSGFAEEISGDPSKMMSATIKALRLYDVQDDEGDNMKGGIQWGT